MIVDIAIGTGLLIVGFITGALVMAHNRKHAKAVDKAADALGDKLEFAGTMTLEELDKQYKAFVNRVKAQTKK